MKMQCILFGMAIHLSVGTFVYGNDIVTTQNTCSKYANIALLVLFTTFSVLLMPLIVVVLFVGCLFHSLLPSARTVHSMCCRVYVNSAKRFNYSRFQAVYIRWQPLNVQQIEHRGTSAL